MALAGAALLALFAPNALGAETPTTVRVTPGAEYRAGALHELFFGKHYRDLWTTPLDVPVLDLRTFAGGLTPTKRGGGLQTKSLRFRGGDGREYAFRMVNKDPTAVLPPALRQTIAGRILQDQISSEHPAGALVVAPLLAAAGILHAEPRLVVLPDDPALGGFRKDFAGALGMLEERPTAMGREDDDEGEGFDKVISTEKLLGRLRKDPREHVDAAAYLKARLFDVFVGDWDRHEDQWRWAREGDKKDSPWLPIPRDRDQAFCRLDGLMPSLAHFFAPQLVSFGDDYPAPLGLVWNSRDLDRRLLPGLERPAWEAAAAELKARLTDAAIDDAVRRLPPELYAKNGAALAAALKRRRDHLAEAAAGVYALLAREVDVTLSDKAERVEVAALPDGRVEVKASALEGKASGAAEPLFARRFDPRETRELRLYLGGGDDQVAVNGGAASAVRLRVVGGAGDDTVEDASGETRLYDAEGEPRVTGAPGAAVDRVPYAPPSGPFAKRAAPRDWGHLWLPAPWLSYAPDVGAFVGGGPIYYGYGFRHDPYDVRVSLRAGYATGAKTYRAELTADLTEANSRRHASLFARASGIEIVRFFGFGNETPAGDPNGDFYKVEQKQYTVFPSIGLPAGEDGTLSLGPVVTYAQTELGEGRFITTARPYGSDRFGQAGLRADYRFDTRDVPAYARRGFFAHLEGSLYPAVWDAERAFGELHGEASTYVGAGGALEPTLAVRVGGKKVWGTYPFYEAAYVGGADTVRGLQEQRYAGDASVYGNAELRVFLTRFFLVLPGELGAFALGDVGRVSFEGQSSGRWHGAVGGGLWFAFLDRANTVTIALARSPDRTGLYVRAGFLF